MPRGLIAVIWMGVFVLGFPARVSFATCPPPGGPAPGIGIGVDYQIQMPNHFPDFQTTVPAYGLNLSTLLGPGEVVVQSVYGTDSDVAMFLTEVGYRWHLPTPFIFFYLYGGTSWLHYTPGVKPSQDYFGAQIGPGVLFSLGDTLDIHMGLKGFLLNKFMLAFDGGLTMRF